MAVHSRNSDNKKLTVVEFDEPNDWVEIRVSGEMNADIASSAIRQGYQMCEEKNCTRILFYALAIELNETFMGAYDLAKHLNQRTGLDRRYKCCVIYDSQRYPVDRAEIMETVATNWHNASMRFFSDSETGTAWLKS